MNDIQINILTRTGRRERLYKILENTINNQTYKNIRHIKSCDNPNCNFLNHNKDTIMVSKNKSAGNGFYNLYLNSLVDSVQNGWVIILDDDAKLCDNTFIERLVDVCKNTTKDNVIIYQTYLWPKKVIFPPNNLMKMKTFKPCKIDMSCFCIHHSALKKYRFDGKRMGDFRLLNNIRNDGKMKFKYVDLKPGIWANYEGELLGA